jgi:hypothetical protein
VGEGTAVLVGSGGVIVEVLVSETAVCASRVVILDSVISDCGNGSEVLREVQEEIRNTLPRNRTESLRWTVIMEFGYPSPRPISTSAIKSHKVYHERSYEMRIVSFRSNDCPRQSGETKFLGSLNEDGHAIR